MMVEFSRCDSIIIIENLLLNSTTTCSNLLLNMLIMFETLSAYIIGYFMINNCMSVRSNYIENSNCEMIEIFCNYLLG